MRLLDSTWLQGSGGEFTTVNDRYDNRILATGLEQTCSAFAQIKHRVLDNRIVLNAGARYDYRQRKSTADLQAISPRLAVVFLPSSSFDIKLSYGRSFVDAPYWYRYNNFPPYKGSPSLRAENLEAVQLTPTIRLFGGRLSNTLNFYYNKASGLVFRQPNPAPGAPNYENSGSVSSMGIEEELAIVGSWFQVRANATYQRVLSANNYLVKPGTSRVNNVPALVGNLVVDVAPFFTRARDFWLNLGFRYSGEQLSPINIVYRDANGTTTASFVEPNHKVAACVLVNAGARYENLFMEHLSIDLRVFNALGTRY